MNTGGEQISLARLAIAELDQWRLLDDFRGAFESGDHERVSCILTAALEAATERERRFREKYQVNDEFRRTFRQLVLATL